MNDEVRRYTGGCRCGSLRYEAVGEPLGSGHCYCADCRRASGSGFVPFRAAMKLLTTPCSVAGGGGRALAMDGSTKMAARAANVRKCMFISDLALLDELVAVGRGSIGRAARVNRQRAR